MYKVTRISENRLDVELTGKLNSADMKALLDELVSKAEGIEHGTMLYRIGDFELPTLGAIGIELSRLPQLFRFIRKFDRTAVLAGKGWIKKISELEGGLIPGLEIKAFELEKVAEAEDWLEGLPGARP